MKAACGAAFTLGIIKHTQGLCLLPPEANRDMSLQ
jgi:hypothetical protein